MIDPVNDGRALQRLLDELGRLPGVGPKSAQRIAYHLLEADAEEARRLANAILDVKQQVHFCPVCFSYATRDTCDVCADGTRDRASICVVSEPRDVTAIERTGTYHGLYHVLGGVISPMDKIGPEQLHVREARWTRSSSPPTRTSRARPRRPIWPASSARSACA
jgi:recombination protein RecR